MDRDYTLTAIDVESAMGLRGDDEFDRFFVKFDGRAFRDEWKANMCVSHQYRHIDLFERARCDQQIFAVFYRILWDAVEGAIVNGVS